MSPNYEFGEFQLDPMPRQLRLKADCRVLPLTARAFDILLYFVERSGHLLDKSTLMQAVWSRAVVEENSLHQNITLLRRTLGESPGEHRYVATVPGRGYRFVASVTTGPAQSIPAQSAVEASSTLRPPAPSDSLVQTPPAILRSVGHRTAISWILVMVAFAATMLLAYLLYDRERPVPPPTATGRDSAATGMPAPAANPAEGHRGSASSLKRLRQSRCAFRRRVLYGSTGTGTRSSEYRSGSISH